MPGTWLLMILAAQLSFTCAVQKFYMEDDCGRIIDMDEEDIPAGRLLVTRRHRYRNQLSCYVTVVAPSNKRLTVVFRSLDIEFESTCDDDYVRLLDGYNKQSPLVAGFPERLCGDSNEVDSYTTSGPNLTVYFESDIQSRDNGFEIVFTAFYEAASCQSNELHCKNGRCIDASLLCNGMDNCGDGSDKCKVSNETVYAIILSVFLLTIVAIGLVTIYRKKHRSNKSRDDVLFGREDRVYANQIRVYPRQPSQTTRMTSCCTPDITSIWPVSKAPPVKDTDSRVFCMTCSGPAGSACRKEIAGSTYFKRSSI